MHQTGPEFMRRLAGFVPSFAGDTLYDGEHVAEFLGALSGRAYTGVHSHAGDTLTGMREVRLQKGKLRGRKREAELRGGCVPKPELGNE